MNRVWKEETGHPEEALEERQGTGRKRRLRAIAMAS